MSFGSRLRERREALGLKQGELGKLLGITGSAIGNYENGVSSPKADILYRVFDVLQCDANYLFQDDMTEVEESEQNEQERCLMDSFRRLNPEGQEKVMEYMDDLLASGKYIKIHSAGLAQQA
jgi:transcriptional regulator with XRE-family HTH domain